MREFIAYEGSAFSIEWYFDARGYSKAKEYFERLSQERQDKVLALFKRMGDHGKINNETKFRSEGGKIFAFKPQPDRFLCFFFFGRKIVVTNAFLKKSDKLPPGEKERALRYKQDYDMRVNRGNYYE